MKSLPCILFIQQFELTMQLTPLIAVHMTAAMGAVILGPFALWARMGSVQRPWLHRAMGYAYATLILLAATSACFPGVHCHSPVNPSHAYQLMGGVSSTRQKRLCDSPHHHAVPLPWRLRDCWRLHFVAISLFGQLDLA